METWVSIPASAIDVLYGLGLGHSPLCPFASPHTFCLVCLDCNLFRARTVSYICTASGIGPLDQVRNCCSRHSCNTNTTTELQESGDPNAEVGATATPEIISLKAFSHFCCKILSLREKTGA